MLRHDLREAAPGMRTHRARTIHTTHVVPADRLDEHLRSLHRPRADLVHEVADPARPGGFVLGTGPFHHYRRDVGEPRPLASGDVQVTERFEYEIAAPMWRLLFRWPVARTLKRPRPGGDAPWWAPPARLDARASTVLALLCTVSMVCGYLGTVITQTITFAADEFGNDKGDQGAALAAVRVGVLLSMAILALADRRGRRALTSWGTIAACVCTVLGAASVDLWTLGATQTLARGITTARIWNDA
jgi:hypothetical protein